MNRSFCQRTERSKS